MYWRLPEDEFPTRDDVEEDSDDDDEEYGTDDPWEAPWPTEAEDST